MDVEVSLKTRYFNKLDPVTILPIFQTFRRESNILLIHKEATKWLLPKYLRDPTKETLQSRMSHQGSKTTGSVMTYYQLINNLLGTYASHDIVVIAEDNLYR